MNELRKALERAADGAFVIDENLQVVYANPAAGEVLGSEPGELTGQPCFRILRGRDEFRRLVCTAHCEVARVAAEGGRVPSYDLQVRAKTGEFRWLNITVFALQGPENGSVRIVHLFRNVTQTKDDERFFEQLLEIARRYHNLPADSESQGASVAASALTRREREVLSLLAQGLTTAEISQHLSISPYTARNHIQRILQKLQVHSRLEAVTYAIRHRLVAWEPPGDERVDEE